MEDIKPIDKFTLDKYVKEEDDLLEYVKQVAMEFCPDVYEGTYILETQALDIFKNRIVYKKHCRGKAVTLINSGI